MKFDWVPGSTWRIAQLTGDYDPEGLRHYTNTLEWGIVGVDGGGANTEFDGRTFIFFGDAAQKQGVNIEYGDPTAFIEDAPFPRSGRLAVASRSQDQLDAFFIGADGALYITWAIKLEQWRGPLRIGSRDVAPPGGAVAAAQQTSDQLDVFFIGNSGALHVAWVASDGIWHEPVPIGPVGVAKPGAHVGAARLTDDHLYVFYFGKNGFMYVHRVIGIQGWQGPEVLDRGFPVAPSGAYVTGIMQTDEQLSVFFIGNDEKLNVYWVKAREHWHGPYSVGTRPTVAPRGACLAAVKQMPNLTTVVFFGHDRKLNVQWVTGAGRWSEPISMGTAQIARPGSAVACVVRPVQGPFPSRTHALAISEETDLIEYYVDGSESWRGPCVIAIRTGAPPGSSLVAMRQNAVQSTVLHGGSTTELKVSWVSDVADLPEQERVPLQRDEHERVLLRWGGPDRINPFMVKLFPVLDTVTGVFFPFTIKEKNRPPVTLLKDSAPEGAFTYEAYAYVLINRIIDGAPMSSLTRSSRPGEALPFDYVFDFSGGPFRDSGRFWHVTPYRVRTTELPGFSHREREGVILFGMGATGKNDNPFGIHLAWLPLVEGQVPQRDQICFYTGNWPDNWSSAERDAVPLFYTKYAWASMSVGRIPQTGHWILLYHRGGLRSNAEARLRDPRPEEETIVARVAETPWDLGKAPEIVVLDPYRDKALGSVTNYMYREGEPDPRNLKKRGEPVGVHPALFYGPGLLNRYTEFDERTETATLHFLISTGWPYQVQLMRTAIRATRPWLFDLANIGFGAIVGLLGGRTLAAEHPRSQGRDQAGLHG